MNPHLRTITLTCFFALLVLNTQCDDVSCNDCLELETKAVLVVDSDGNNLVFGAFAIYDPVAIQLIAGDTQDIFVQTNEENGTIVFSIEQDFESYELILSETESDIISFDTDLRPSSNCCGSVRFSTATFLNGETVPNETLITIVKD